MEIRKVFILTLFAGVLCAIFSFVLANAYEMMNVEADIIVPDKIVRIEVPDYVYLGNITVGYNMKTDETKIMVNNTGTVNVTVTPMLSNLSEEIFSYLYFTKRLSGDSYGWERVGDWSIDIKRPGTFGGFEDEYFYTRLDLENYTGDIYESMLGHRTEIVFIAVED